jgi:hypothetical protein
MTMRRLATIFVACTAFLGGLTVPAAAADDLPACATTPEESVIARYENPGRWIYTFQVIWCVEDGVIKWRKPIVTAEVLDPLCRWVGNMEESEKQVDPTTWHVFNMGKFECEDPAGPSGEHPWAIVGVSPNGDSAVIDGGVAPAD